MRLITWNYSLLLFRPLSLAINCWNYSIRSINFYTDEMNSIRNWQNDTITHIKKEIYNLDLGEAGAVLLIVTN